MHTPYFSNQDYSGIFLQAVDQHYVNNKDENRSTNKTKDKSIEDNFDHTISLMDKNFNFLNDSTDIESAVDEELSRKDSILDSSASSSMVTGGSLSSNEKGSKIKLSESLLDNWNVDIKLKKDKIFSNLKNFLYCSNYMQVNGYIQQNSEGINCISMGMGMNVINPRNRCYSYPPQPIVNKQHIFNNEFGCYVNNVGNGNSVIPGNPGISSSGMSSLGVVSGSPTSTSIPNPQNVNVISPQNQISSTNQSINNPQNLNLAYSAPSKRPTINSLINFSMEQ